LRPLKRRSGDCPIARLGQLRAADDITHVELTLEPAESDTSAEVVATRRMRPAAGNNMAFNVSESSNPPTDPIGSGTGRQNCCGAGSSGGPIYRTDGTAGTHKCTSPTTAHISQEEHAPDYSNSSEDQSFGTVYAFRQHTDIVPPAAGSCFDEPELMNIWDIALRVTKDQLGVCVLARRLWPKRWRATENEALVRAPPAVNCQHLVACGSSQWAI